MRHSISIGGGVAWLSADGAIFKQPNRCARSIPRRERPRCASTLSLQRQRAQGKPGVRCTRSLVCSVLVAHQCSHHRFTGTPGFPRAMVLTAYFVLSPVTGLFCHRRLADIGASRPGRARNVSAKLDASVGASGPHDLAFRNNAVRLHAVSCSRARRTALRPRLRADAVASTASRPASVTIASRPSGDETGELIEVILASVIAEYFSNQGWTGFADLPDGRL